MTRPVGRAAGSSQAGGPSGAVLPLPGAVSAGAVMLASTAPGQTGGVSVFVDPMLADLVLGRTALSTAYTVGTLIAAAGLTAVGVAVDRWGVRRALVVVALTFGAALAGMATVAGVASLVVGFAAIRLLGAGALNLLSSTAVAVWTRRRRGTAIGLAAAIGSAGIAVAPLGLQWVIDHFGWRSAWLTAGAAVWLVLLPLAWILPAGRPAEPATARGGELARPLADGTLHRGIDARPLRSPFFWTLLAAVAVNSLIGTGLIFHQISLLTDRGLSPAAAAATFLPQTVAGLLAAAAAGRLADRIRPHHLLIPNMALTAAALALAPHASPGWPVLVYAITLGASIGAIRTVEGACLAYYFGTATLGMLRGLTLTAIVAAAAPGPLPLAWAKAETGGYAAATTALLVLPAAVAFAAILTAPPSARTRLTGPPR